MVTLTISLLICGRCPRRNDELLACCWLPPAANITEPALTRPPARPAILKLSTVCERARKKSSFCRESGVAPELGVLRLRGSGLRCSLDERPRFLKWRVDRFLEAALAPTDFQNSARFGSAGTNFPPPDPPPWSLLSSTNEFIPTRSANSLNARTDAARIVSTPASS